MSIASYRQNVKRRVAGPHKPVCFPAALEQISPNHRYHPSVYPYYEDHIDWHYSIPRAERDDYVDEEAKMYDRLLRPLGLTSWEEAIYRRANTELGFLRIVRPLLAEEFRVVVDVTYGGSAKNGTHAIGLIPTGEKDHVMTVSTHVQKALHGIVTLQQVAAHLGYPPEKRMPDYPFNDANIVALPYC